LLFVLMVAWLLTFLFPKYFLPVPIAQSSLLLLMVCISSAISASLFALSIEGAKKDFGKIPYAWFLNFLLTPVMAYAALKGLFTRKGHFHRTYKTGKILAKSSELNV